jgi:hypothetical protein
MAQNKGGIDFGDCSITCFQTRGTNVTKRMFSIFLYVKGLLFICIWWCFSKEFLLKIYKLKYMAFLCNYYRFWHTGNRGQKGGTFKMWTFLSNFNGLLLWCIVHQPSLKKPLIRKFVWYPCRLHFYCMK